MDVYSEYNDFIICPYNKSHRVERGTRFQRHLIECRKNYPDVEEVSCPFNYTHRIKKPEYHYHVSVCEDSHPVKKQLITVENTEEYVPPVLEISRETNPDNIRASEENWDDDSSTQIFDKVQNFQQCTGNNLTFINADRLSGLKPAKKREIRKKISHGEDYENILEAPQPVIETQLKPLPKPVQQSESEQVRKLGKLGLARGLPLAPQPPIIGSTRIAAGIFPQQNLLMNPVNPMFSMPPSPLLPVAPMSPIPPIGLPGIGHSNPVRPPPGLEPVICMGSMGRGFGRILLENENASHLRSSDKNFHSESSCESNDFSSKISTCSDDLKSLSGIKSNSCDDKSDLDEEIKQLILDEPKVPLVEDKAKKMRRLEKKLRQIENLKKKREDGKVLNDEEMAKVKCERKLKDEIEELASDLSG